MLMPLHILGGSLALIFGYAALYATKGAGLHRKSGTGVAAASFFWGPPNRVPELIRIPALLRIPVLAPVAVMLYWLWKMRGRRASRSASLSASERPVEVMS